MNMSHSRFCGWVVAAFLMVLGEPAVAAVAPTMSPYPVPAKNGVNVTVYTSIYFEVSVPAGNLPDAPVDPNSITITLSWSGGSATVLGQNQQFGAGFGGQIKSLPPYTYGVFAFPNASLGAPSRPYTVQVTASTLPCSTNPLDVNCKHLDGANGQWSFTTRGELPWSTQPLDIDLAGPTTDWMGRWFGGAFKFVTYDVSLLAGLEPVYQLIEDAQGEAPELFRYQRDYGLTLTYENGLLEGNANLVREVQTRRITAINGTTLTLADMPERALYGIAPNRPLNGDYFVGNTVLVCDLSYCEQAVVQAVNDVSKTITVSQLANRPWFTTLVWPPPCAPGQYVSCDSPDTPDSFPRPYATLRKLNPAGTPVYYFTRLDHEIDRLVSHGRRPILNFVEVPYDLCTIDTGPASAEACSFTAKNWIKYHNFVMAVIKHLIDRYGSGVADWQFSMGNEPDGAIGRFAEFYDYTVNAILKAFDDRLGTAVSAGVKVGGVELTGFQSNGILQRFLSHAHPGVQTQPACNPPTVYCPLQEENFVCKNPNFFWMRALRTHLLCGNNNNRGSPVDFVSVHTYGGVYTGNPAAGGVSERLIAARNTAMQLLYGGYFNNLAINSYESAPWWWVVEFPDALEVFRWGGYYPTWGGDFFRRLLNHAQTNDPGFARGQAASTMWPSVPQLNTASIALQFQIDDNGDGVGDRFDAAASAFFRFAELTARMSHTVAPLSEIVDLGVTISGWRSVEGGGRHKILFYAHDPQDTGSRETGGWEMELTLHNVPPPAINATVYRVDRTHPARAAMAALAPLIPANGVYSTPQQLQAIEDLKAADDLVADGPADTYTVNPDGTVEIPVSLYSQGVVLLDIEPAP